MGAVAASLWALKGMAPLEVQASCSCCRPPFVVADGMECAVCTQAAMVGFSF